jgi:hypothetical protein
LGFSALSRDRAMPHSERTGPIPANAKAESRGAFKHFDEGRNVGLAEAPAGGRAQVLVRQCQI